MPKLRYICDAGVEEMIPLSQVPHLPIIGRGSRGKRVAPSTIYRWASRGCRGVQLEVLRVGGVLKTTQSAVERFTRRLCGQDAQLTSQPGTNLRHRRSQEELRKAGI
jgi:hypothetical protein